MEAFAQRGELVHVSKNDSEQNRIFPKFCLIEYASKSNIKVLSTQKCCTMFRRQEWAPL